MKEIPRYQILINKHKESEIKLDHKKKLEEERELNEIRSFKPNIAQRNHSYFKRQSSTTVSEEPVVIHLILPNLVWSLN